MIPNIVTHEQPIVPPKTCDPLQVSAGQFARGPGEAEAWEVRFEREDTWGPAGLEGLRSKSKNHPFEVVQNESLYYHWKEPVFNVS